MTSALQKEGEALFAELRGYSPWSKAEAARREFTLDDVLVLRSEVADLRREDERARVTDCEGASKG